jgi:hypothetical protein
MFNEKEQQKLKEFGFELADKEDNIWILERDEYFINFSGNGSFDGLWVNNIDARSETFSTDNFLNAIEWIEGKVKD